PTWRKRLRGCSTCSSNSVDRRNDFSILYAASARSPSRNECMPRQLLRDGRIVADDWTYLMEAGGAVASGSADSSNAIILTFDQWRSDEPGWRAAPGRLGVI